MEFSLCMIVKNEEDVLARCLDCIKDIADEIIIVDTGSTDSTKEIAARYTSRVYDFAWIDDFSAARNASFSYASKPYCMWLDADDILLAEDQKALLELKNSLPEETDIVMLPYHTGFDREGKPTFTYYRERIVRNSPLYRWQGAVHECISPNGVVRYEEAAISHQKLHPSPPDRNLNILKKQLDSGKTLAPREQYYFARELYYHAQYEEAAKEFTAFLNSRQGWLENNLEACRFLSYCFYQQKEEERALQSLLHSFQYDVPRAETCCDIGKHFLERQQYKQAVFWYDQALAAPRNDKNGGFVEPDCYDYIPYLQLCVCWYHLGETAKASRYNELAAGCKPASEACAFNTAFFQNA